MSEIKSFSKIFETADMGQFLVFKDSTDDGRPCVRLMFYASKFAAMATATLNYPDSDIGYSEVDRVFDEFSLDRAMRVAADFVDAVSGGVGVEARLTAREPDRCG
jgi:hypothetical protein